MEGKFRLETAPSFGSPYFEFTRSDGSTVFDTRDKLFRVTEVFKGSLVIPFRNTPVNSVTNYFIGNCALPSDFVLGYMRTTEILFGGIELNPFPDNNEWFFMCGTFVGFPNPGFANIGGTDCMCYTFIANNGQVVLEEQVAVYEIKNTVGQTLQLAGFTLEYELWVGTFV